MNKVMNVTFCCKFYDKPSFLHNEDVISFSVFLCTTEEFVVWVVIKIQTKATIANSCTPVVVEPMSFMVLLDIKTVMN